MMTQGVVWFWLFWIYPIVDAPSTDFEFYVPFIVSVFFFGLGVFLVFTQFAEYRKICFMEDTPTSKAESVDVGRVEVKGKVGPAGETLESPFTRNECVAYEYKEQVWRSHNGGGRWITTESHVESVPFYIEDETGKVLVDPKHADFDIMMSKRILVEEGEELPEEVRDYIENRKPKEDKRVQSTRVVNIGQSMKKRRFAESYIAPGRGVYVFGTATQDRDFVDEVVEQDLEEGSEGVSDDIVIRKPSTFRTLGRLKMPVMIISTLSDDDIVAGSRRRALFLTLVGVILLGASVTGFFGYYL